MKALICLWGHVRYDLNTVIENISKIIPDYKYDLLISTWKDQVFNESLFKYLIKSSSPTKEFLDSINFPYTRQIKNVNEWHGLRFGHYAQFYHNYKISQLINSGNLYYDVLIKSRTDVMFETDFIFDFKSDTCYVPHIYWGSKGVGINDHFVCGKFNYVKKCINMEIFEDFFPSIESSWNPETAQQKLIMSNQCSYVEFDCQSYMLVPDRKML